MAIISSAARFSSSNNLSAPSHFSTPTRFLSPWSCSPTRTEGGEFSFSGFLRPDAASSPYLCRQPLSSLGRLGSSEGRACVLERPTSDQCQLDPAVQVEAGGNSGDTGKLSNQEVTTREGRYKVLLVYARRHTEKLVMEILPEVVSSVTPEEARRLFHESRNECTAIVIVAVKEQAEFYVETMVEKGLRAAMEPESLPG